ncbi:hypothetical protein [Bacillus atrophaeus]|uniref:hypothetical protein n=1 Tax=Bacillus atrophaeus TaxID=1452 RepID=UPI002E1B4B2E|nr:hypothetical protein [Bacillus atrophaeus]
MKITSYLRNFTYNIETKYIEESLQRAEIRIQTSKIIIDKLDCLKEMLSKIHERDSLLVEFQFGTSGELCIFRKQIDFNEFIDEIRLEQNLLFNDEEETDKSIQIKVIISKEIVDQRLSIYDMNAFREFLGCLSMKAFFSRFSNLIKQHNRLKFEVLNDTGVEAGTETFWFSSTGDFPDINQSDRKKIELNRRNASNFKKNFEFDVIPEDFILLKNKGLEDIEEIFNKIFVLLSIGFLADISTFYKDGDDNNAYYVFKGHRDIEFDLEYKNFDLKAIWIFTDFYKWAFDGEHFIDKIGLARNVITRQIKVNTADNNKVFLSDQAFNSLQSSYRVFQKENIEQYIQIKNTVSELLLNMSHQTSELVSGLASALKSNQLLIATFFGTALVLNALSSNKFEDIFTKDVMTISYAILVISFIFLVASKWYAWMERSRFKVQYERLKGMYKDILDTEDIQNIFGDDLAHREDLKFLKNKIWLFSIIWFFEIITLFGAILYLKVC